MKLKYLRQPIRTTKAAGDLLAARLEMRRIAKQGERRFKGDSRYKLSALSEGFSCRIDNKRDDTALLNRICTAYQKTFEQQRFAPGTYDATPWWQEVRERSLRPVMGALLTRNLDALRAMYRNFFRHPCSTGLINVPYGMFSAYFGKSVTNVHCHYYLSEVLHRVDHWKAQTSGRFSIDTLAGPRIGNPFGAFIADTLIDSGSPYRHYCAQQVSNLLASGEATVIEIGGGFGGMAYYLLRDRPGTTYIDLDTPESIALASYYLITAFPDLKFVLYGEEIPTKEAIAHADVALLPLFELPNMPPGIADISFSSHSMSDLTQHAFREYLSHIARITMKRFLYIGVDRRGGPLSRSIGYNHHFSFRSSRVSEWQSHPNSSLIEVECLYDLQPVQAEHDRDLRVGAS
jgi:hypothetical protein